MVVEFAVNDSAGPNVSDTCVCYVWLWCILHLVLSALCPTILLIDALICPGCRSTRIRLSSGAATSSFCAACSCYDRSLLWSCFKPTHGGVLSGMAYCKGCTTESLR